MDRQSFRDLLLFGIGFASQQNRPLLRRIAKEHVSDDARRNAIDLGIGRSGRDLPNNTLGARLR